MSKYSAVTDITDPSKPWALMDRIMSINNVPLVQSNVTTVGYTVQDITDPTNITTVGSGTFSVSSVVFNSLQTTGWDTDQDALGYNFRIDWALALVPQTYSLIYQYEIVLTLVDSSIVTFGRCRQTLEEPPTDLYYGSPQGGDVYFSRKYGHDAWKAASEDDKISVLVESTRRIDLLNFFGRKTISTQPQQFPRGGDTQVPKEIAYAAYEESYQILLGRDIDQETLNRNVQQRKFGPVSTTYLMNARYPANVGAGILSTVAWRFLIPYLRRSEDVTLVRIS